MRSVFWFFVCLLVSGRTFAQTLSVPSAWGVRSTYFSCHELDKLTAMFSQVATARTRASFASRMHTMLRRRWFKILRPVVLFLVRLCLTDINDLVANRLWHRSHREPSARQHVLYTCPARYTQWKQDLEGCRDEQHPDVDLAD